jgi:hypothetical protein
MTARLLCLSFFACQLAPSAFSQPLPDRKPVVGVTVDSVGKPLAGALVSIRRQDDSGSYAFWGDSVASNQRGEFRFERAETGRYYLNAEVTGFAPIYNQSVIWQGNAPLRLQFQRLVNFRPQLARPDGSPAANQVVWLRLRGEGSAGQISRRVQADARGQITVEGLLPSNYALYLASDEGFALLPRIELQSNLAPEIQLQKGGRLRVTVRAKDAGTALGGALLSLIPESRQEAVRLGGVGAPANDDFGLLGAMGEPIALVSRDGDGLIEISNLPAGRYSAKVVLPSYLNVPVQSIAIREGETAESEWVLTPKSSAKASLTLQLRTENETPIPSAQEWTLRLLPINADGTLATEQTIPDIPDGTSFSPAGHPGRRVIANATGQLIVSPLVPGRYRVFISPRTPQATENPNDPSDGRASLDLELKAGENKSDLFLKPSQK